jgi:hypothetical protein
MNGPGTQTSLQFVGNSSNGRDIGIGSCPAPDTFGMTLNDEPAASRSFVASSVVSTAVSKRVQKKCQVVVRGVHRVGCHS